MQCSFNWQDKKGDVWQLFILRCMVANGEHLHLMPTGQHGGGGMAVWATVIGPGQVAVRDDHELICVSSVSKSQTDLDALVGLGELCRHVPANLRELKRSCREKLGQNPSTTIVSNGKWQF